MAKTRKQRIKNNSRAKTIKNNKNLLSNEGDMEGGAVFSTEKYGLYFQFQNRFNGDDKFKKIRNFLKKTCLFFLRGYYISIKGVKSKNMRSWIGRHYSDPANRGPQSGKEFHVMKQEAIVEDPIMNKYKYFLGGYSQEKDRGIAEENYLYMLQSVVGGTGLVYHKNKGLLGYENYFDEFTAKLKPFEMINGDPIDENNILEFIMDQLKDIEGVDSPTPQDNYDIHKDYTRFLTTDPKITKFWYTGYVQALTELAYKLLYPKSGVLSIYSGWAGLKRYAETINDFRNIISITKANSEMTDEQYKTMPMNKKEYYTPFLFNNVESAKKMRVGIKRVISDWDTYSKIQRDNKEPPMGEGTSEMLGKPPNANWEEGNQVYKIILMMKLFRFVCRQGKTAKGVAKQESADITGTRSAAESTGFEFRATFGFKNRFDNYTIRMFNRINEAAAQLSTINDIMVKKD
tara:strand:+ start:263 stop:1639 length:1377 start_codon:yes stop_codon:yes gene_type:complete